jgi:hypothetical protein
MRWYEDQQKQSEPKTVELFPQNRAGLPNLQGSGKLN